MTTLSSTSTIAERLIVGLDWMERSIRRMNDVCSSGIDLVTNAWTQYVNTTFVWNFLVDYWYIVILLVFFWPVWINLIVALATASGWLFWLMASIGLGCLQVVYATYQFVCIAVDIFILSLLKTFAMLRTQILQLSVMSGLISHENGGRKSRRRVWKEHMRQASTYDEFCQLPIEEPRELHLHQCHKSSERSTSGSASRKNLTQSVVNVVERIVRALMGHADQVLDSTVDEKDVVQHFQTSTTSEDVGTATTTKTELIRKSRSCMDFSPVAHVSKKKSMNQRRQRRTKSGTTSSDHQQQDSNDETSSETSDSAEDDDLIIMDDDTRDHPDAGSRTTSTSTTTTGMLTPPPSSTSMTPPTPPVFPQSILPSSSSSPSENNRKTYSPSRSLPILQQQKSITKKTSNGPFRSAANLLTVLSKSSSDREDIDDNRDNEFDIDSHEHRMFVLRIERELGTTGSLLIATTERLREARYQATMEDGGDGASALKFLLAGVVKRNHLSVDDYITEDSRSIAECGRHFYSHDARMVVRKFIEEVEECLHYLAHSPITATSTSTTTISPPSRRNSFIELARNGNTTSASTSDQEQQQHQLPVTLNGGKTSGTGGSHSMLGAHNNNPYSNSINAEAAELADRIKQLSKMKMNTGCSALMLSGGGAQAMYHLGTIRALVESGIWNDIPVISGTSGGSISAAMCAMKTEDELLRDVCVPEVSTDFLRTGRMSKENIRWFPTLWEMIQNWLKSRLLVDSKEFKRCCDFYFGDMTFEEAYLKTRKHVCITVSASRSGGTGGGGAQRLLLNHISTPHVTLSSAVAASCALPGVMKPAKLMAKDSMGHQVVFEVDGVEWIDGSVQADLPFKRISTLFNVSNFIVAQVNFHVVPFLNKAYHPSTKSLYWKLFQVTEWDVRSRALNLARLGLFPKIFGQDVSKVFKQKYHGNITLVPKFTMMQVFGMQVLSNPTYKDMQLYIQNGQKSSWPYLNSIQLMLRLEKAIDDNLVELKERFRQLPQDLQTNYDLEGSFCGGSTNIHHSQQHDHGPPHICRSSRDSHFLKVKIRHLEAENNLLRKRLLEMEQQQQQQQRQQTRRDNEVDDKCEEEEE